MNYQIRFPRAGNYLKTDEKLRQLLEPLAKILCSEKKTLEDWKKKNPNGFWEYNYPGGKKYKGEWKDGEYHGQGIISWSGSVAYEGEWKDGERHGKGTTMTDADGRGYKGEWKNGQMHGQGTLTTQGSGKTIGEFKSDTIWNGISYDKEGIITRKILEGEYKKTNLKLN